MPTYYVPIERNALPACDPKRWFLLSVEAKSAPCAITQATRIASQTMRLKPRDTTVWAASRTIPCFASLQLLRDEFDSVFQRKAAKAAPKTEAVLRVATEMGWPVTDVPVLDVGAFA
jgi:hypothetical protein